MNDFSTLAKHQSNLLNTIFATNNIAIEAINTPHITKNSISNRGIHTYQANATASAKRSLQSAYPVIARMIGDETFAHLARDFWQQHPPTRGDLTQWGGDLPVFIASISALQTEPYLSDVATVEWALHAAATAMDKTADLTSFSLLTEQDPDALTLRLAPGTELVHSQYPIASILTAHLYDSPSFEEVGQKLRQKLPEISLVWRQGLRPKVALCTAADAAFVGQLLAGKSLLAALDPTTADQTEKEDNFDFNAWLPIAVQNGLLLGAQLL
jgi:Putative DNA-binding domain